MNDEFETNEDIPGIAGGATLSERLPKGYLSVSQIGQYMKCGRAYEFRYVLDKPIPKTSFTALGSAVHAAAEKLHVGMMEAALPPPLEFVESAFSDAHDAHFEDPDVVIMEEDADGKTKDVGMKLTRLYYKGAIGELIDPETKEPLRKIYPIAAERVVRTMLKPTEGDEVPFLGIIDLEEAEEVADLKTKRKKGNQGEVDNSLQLSLYAHVTGKKTVRHDQLIKPSAKLPERLFRIRSTRTDAEIEHAVNIAADVATDIARGRFPLTMPDNWWCTEKWCPFWSDCRGKKR